MISMFFGKPGEGKTTLLAKIAKDSVGKYPNIYTNVHLAIPGVTYVDDDCIGKYELRDCLILIDEASLFADNRDFKNFNKNGTRLEYFLTHRHHCATILLFTQGYNAVDKKLRDITVNLYRIYKPFLTGHWFTKYYPIAYDIYIPQTGEQLGKIIEGYAKPSFLFRLFTTKRIYRPKYYQYFDSWEITELPSLPDRYQPYQAPEGSKKRKFSFSLSPRRLIRGAITTITQEGSDSVDGHGSGSGSGSESDSD